MILGFNFSTFVIYSHILLNWFLMMPTLATSQNWKNKTLISIQIQKLTRLFHVLIWFYFSWLNIGDIAMLTVEKLDWKSRMNIALNAAQGKWFNYYMIFVEWQIFANQSNFILISWFFCMGYFNFGCLKTKHDTIYHNVKFLLVVMPC